MGSFSSVEFPIDRGTGRFDPAISHRVASSFHEDHVFTE